MNLKKQLYEATLKLEEKEKERMLQIDFGSAEILRKDQEITNLTSKLWVSTIYIYNTIQHNFLRSIIVYRNFALNL